MKIERPFYTLIYSLGRITLGLLLHPYQTMQSLLEEKRFIWMTLLPTVVLAIATILWKYVIVPVVQTVFSCQRDAFIFCDWIPFVSDWLTFFCLFWQVMLMYLLFRFHWAFGKLLSK